MTNQTIEQAVEEICSILNSIPKFKTVVDEDTHVGIQDTLREALQAQRDAGAREERERVGKVIEERLKCSELMLRELSGGNDMQGGDIDDQIDHNSLKFLQSAYGIQSQTVNDYHIKLRHADYDGWFDWYHTTGTIIANRNGGTNNLGKYKNDEELAIKLTKHIYD